jgi:hypothetical protein
MPETQTEMHERCAHLGNSRGGFKTRRVRAGDVRPCWRSEAFDRVFRGGNKLTRRSVNHGR